MAVLEERVWAALDTVAALTLRVQKQRCHLPLGLLQLRPPPADTPKLREQPTGASPQQYANAASGGLDSFADPAWPLVRRAEKLGWAVAICFSDADRPAQRQGVLECTSIIGRLKLALAMVLEAQHVLAAMAAVASVSESSSGDSSQSEF